MPALQRNLLAPLALLAWSAAAFAQEGPEEFNGPFANWLNAQTGYGATGDCITDDTTSLTNAINALSSTNPTLYLPAPSSCYKITAELPTPPPFTRVICASPSATTIGWYGSAGGTMLLVNGMAYGEVNRCTFNGHAGTKAASMDIDQNWNGSIGAFDTENQYADDVFEGASYGIRCGAGGKGCAETVTLRSTFSGLTTSGIDLGNFNALDMFLWYSRFINNAVGVSNTLKAGNFSIYESDFSGSTTADIQWGNINNFNLRWNYSDASNRFISSYSTSNPCPVNIQGNTIIDTTQALSISTGCDGPMIMFDNIIRSASGHTTGPVVMTGANGWGAGSYFGAGNTYTLADPVGTSEINRIYGSNYSLGDSVVPRTSVNPTAPVLPGAPPFVSRTVTEVTAGSSNTTIQNAINAETGTRPVIHLQAGTYTGIHLTCPANSDMQIIGDGWYTLLEGDGTDPVISCAGGSDGLYETFRDFRVLGKGGPGIVFTGVDQPGARVFMEGVGIFLADYSVTGGGTNLLVNGLSWANVEAHDFYDTGDAIYGPTGTVGVSVIGPSGAWNGSVTKLYAGVTYQDYTTYSVTNGGYLLADDRWHDLGSGGGPYLLNVSGIGGAATVFGGTTYMPGPDSISVPPPGPSFLANNYTGAAAIIGHMYFQGGPILFDGGDDSQMHVTVLGTMVPSALASFISMQAGGQYAFWQNQTKQFVARTDVLNLPDSQNFISPAFWANTLYFARTLLPTIPGSPTLTSGSTDLRLYRVWVQDASTGISISP
jgi:hypothetical protein